jgi:hypothetical protein
MDESRMVAALRNNPQAALELGCRIVATADVETAGRLMARTVLEIAIEALRAAGITRAELCSRRPRLGTPEAPRTPAATLPAYASLHHRPRRTRRRR